MPHIHQFSDDDATGDVKAELDAAVRRAGRVWNIVRIMTPNVDALKASMAMYSVLMFGPGPLARAQREMLGVVVSRANSCHY